MPLPGKLCIGILEEDNPLKSYFRFKPILVEENGLYIPFSESDVYPEDGCIRIVPDKNESSHFKARMRRIGLFAVVDLSAHPGENDKIRVNKNYRGDETERNAFIIYSDVVREPAAGMILSVMPLAAEASEGSVLSQRPLTPQLLLCSEGAPLDELWTADPVDESEEAYQLRRTGQSAALGERQRFDLPGFNGDILSFVILPPAKVSAAAESAPAKPPKVVPIEARPEGTPAEVIPTPAVEPQSEKPWLNQEPPTARAANAAPFPFNPALAAQAGLNPRRGRSLQEIIDDKWRHSRIDQLGHPVPGSAQTVPVQSPAEKAVSALQSAWAVPDQRETLLNAFVSVEGLERALDVRRAVLRESAVIEQLNDLEAQRLEILADLDVLKNRKATLRGALKQEIREDEAAALADAIRRTEQAKAECIRHEEAAARAKSAADCAEDALNALADGRFEQRLQEFAINSRAVDLLRRLDGAGAKEPDSIQGEDASADELILRTLECFADAGMPIERNAAINLLICFAQSPVLLVSGPAGSGKTSVVRLLAHALGIEQTNYAAYAPGTASLENDERLAAICSVQVPAIALLDDANLCPSGDLTRGLFMSAAQGRLTLCATLQDAGAPVPAYLFGRAFTVRLTDDPCTPWKPAMRSAAKTYPPVALSALRAAFAPQPEAIPQAELQRMEKLRADLDLLGIRLSPATLNALWNYCSAAIPLMSAAPAEVLDLALAQRALPAIFAGAPLDALAALPTLLAPYPRCHALLSSPLPLC